jgi:transcription elongation factor S-II
MSTRRRDHWKTQYLAVFSAEKKDGDLGDLLKHQGLAEELERGIHRKYKLDGDYEKKAQQILLNLDPQSYVKNTYLCAGILNGTVAPLGVVKLTPQELFPANWKEVIAKNDLQRQKEQALKPATTDMFQCPKCKKRQTTYYEQQTRGADEPMTIFISCVSCGKQWRM